jgi:hypothetical protein
MQLLKGNFAKWLRETFPELRPQGFAWQEGFGAFSIGVSGVEDTIQPSGPFVPERIIAGIFIYEDGKGSVSRLIRAQKKVLPECPAEP